MLNSPDAATAALNGYMDSEDEADQEEEKFENILDDYIGEISDDASEDDDFVQELIANHPEAVRAWADNHRESIMQHYGD